MSVKSTSPVNPEWRTELNRISARYLTIGTVIAILLNPVFGVIDYITLHESWQHFMIVRVFVSFILVACVMNRKYILESPQQAGFIILSAIVTQDAYFYSMATRDIIQALSLSYMADFVGAGMVLLWNPVYAGLFLLYFLAVNIIFFSHHAHMDPMDFLTGGGMLVFAGAVFSMAMIVFRYHSVKSMIISRLELMKNNHWMAVQNEIIEEKSAALQKSNNRLKEFAYIVSHDLKAPLRGIRNIAMWIREDCAHSLNEEGNTHLQLMDKQIQKMENLIKAVLEYSKTGVSRNNYEWINLDEMIRDVIEMVEVDKRTSFKIKSDLIQIRGTRVVLSQVLQNLLSNSIKHNDKQFREVNIEVDETDRAFHFVVADNGPGIDPRYHQKIFDLFQTLSGNNDYESTGIGLPVAKKMIEEAGGDMWLESQTGEGSRFHFSIPKEAPEK